MIELLPSALLWRWLELLSLKWLNSAGCTLWYFSLDYICASWASFGIHLTLLNLKSWFQWGGEVISRALMAERWEMLQNCVVGVGRWFKCMLVIIPLILTGISENELMPAVICLKSHRWKKWRLWGNYCFSLRSFLCFSNSFIWRDIVQQIWKIFTNLYGIGWYVLVIAKIYNLFMWCDKTSIYLIYSQFLAQVPKTLEISWVIGVLSSVLF